MTVRLPRTAELVEGIQRVWRDRREVFGLAGRLLFVGADSDVAMVIAFSPHRVDEDGLKLPGVYDPNRAYR